MLLPWSILSGRSDADKESRGGRAKTKRRKKGLGRNQRFGVEALEDRRLLAFANVLVNNPNADLTSQNTQSETSLIAFGNMIVVGFNDSGSFIGGASKFTGYSVSTDGGNTFQDRGTLPTNAGGDAGDPVLARDDLTGTIYFATLQFNGSGMQVFRSFDNGFTFTAPVQGAPGKTGFQDKEWLTVDNFPGPGRGNVYLIERDFGAGNGIYFFRSTDGGNTFGPSGGTLITTGGQGAYVVVGPDHSVYAFYFDSTGPAIRVRKSTDQGVTFGAPVTVTNILSTGVNGDLGLSPGFRTNTFPSVAVNPVSGNLYIVYPDNPAGPDRANIFFRQSVDGGATWSAAVRVNDDFGATNDQWQPAITVKPDGTALFIGWYDRRLDPANNLIDNFGRIATITGNAVTFPDPSFRITDVSYPPIFGNDPVVNPVYMGDYDQAVASNSFAFYTWGDNRLGQNDVRFAKIPWKETFRVVSQTPSATFLNRHGLVNLDLTFSEAVDIANFNFFQALKSFKYTNPNTGTVTNIPITALSFGGFSPDAKTLRILFDPTKTDAFPSPSEPIPLEGTWEVQIGPNIHPAARPLENMDQDQDGTQNEDPEDRYVATVVIEYCGIDPADAGDDPVPPSPFPAAPPFPPLPNDNRVFDPAQPWLGQATDLTGFFSLPDNSTFTGLNRSIRLEDDLDWYKIVTPTLSNGELTVSMTPRAPFLDAVIQVFDANGNPVAVRDANGNVVTTVDALGRGVAETLRLSGAIPGQIFYIRFSSTGIFDTEDCGDYDLSIGFGRNYFVDASNVNPGDGTPANPFRTIQDAVKRATASLGPDTILVFGNNSGDFRQLYVWQSTGDANNDGILDGNMTIGAEDRIRFISQTLLDTSFGPSGIGAPIYVKMQNNIIDVLGEFRVEGGNRKAKTNNTVTALNDNGVTNSTITFTTAGDLVHPNAAVNDINVTLNITHPRINDLLIELVGPSGQVVRLIEQRGAAGQSFTGTMLDDQATRLIGATPPNGTYTGTFRPEQPLTGMTGESVVGTWTLRITDLKTGLSGTLNSWGLDINSRSFPVVFTSFQDDQAGGDTNLDGNISAPNRTDWGGIRFRGNAVDQGATMATGALIDNADIRYTGATLPDPARPNPVGGFFATEFGSVRMEYTRLNDPTLGPVEFSAQVRVLDTIFQHGGKAFDVDMRSLGQTRAVIEEGGFAVPDVANVVTGPQLLNIFFNDNSINGLFVNIPFQTSGQSNQGVIPPLEVDSHWDDVGVPYVITERLTISSINDQTRVATLTIDPGMVIKMQKNSISFVPDPLFTINPNALFNPTLPVGRVLVNGTLERPVVFTSLTDDSLTPGTNIDELEMLYNNGSADTNNDRNNTSPAPGDFGGLVVAEGYIEHGIVRYGGGLVPVRGIFDNQAAIEVLSQDLRGLGGSLHRFTISNTEVSQTFSGVNPSDGRSYFSPAIGMLHTDSSRNIIELDAAYSPATGQITIIDNYIHDNLGVGIGATPPQYNTMPHPLGGYGAYYRRNVIENNAFGNGVSTSFTTGNFNVSSAPPARWTSLELGLPGLSYIDDTDIVQTLPITQTTLNDITTQFQRPMNVYQSIFPNDVAQIMSKRTVSPSNGFLDKWPRFVGQGFDAALNEFLAALPYIRPSEQEGPNIAANNTLATAQNIQATAFLTRPDTNDVFGILPTATVRGFLGADDVDFYSFQAGAGTAYFDIDATNGADTILALFNSAGTLLAFSDDDDGDPGSFSGLDSFVGVFNLPAAGTYYVAVSEFANFPTASSVGTTLPLARPDGGTGGVIVNGATPGDSSYLLNGPQPLDASSYTLQITAQNPLGPRPANGDEGLFTTYIDFERTARGVPVDQVSAADPGKLRGDEWRDVGVDFQRVGAMGVFTMSAAMSGGADPFTVRSGTHMLTTADPANGTIELVFPNQVAAVGFWVVDNEVTSPNEKIEYFDDGGNLLESLPLPTTAGGPVLVARISKRPIFRVVITEDPQDKLNSVFADAPAAPVNIPDNSVLFRKITIGSSFTITDLNVELNIDHARVGDLDVRLTGPGGQTVRLFDVSGQPSQNSRNIRGLTLDDAGILPITQGSAPFSATFKPIDPLSVFNNTNAQGDWTLQIVDRATGNTGSLKSWALRFDSEGLPFDVAGIDDLYYVDAGQSLVIKAEGPQSGFVAGDFDGFDVDANGNLVTGGTLRVMGQPENPVIITSLADDASGAGVVNHVLWNRSGGNDRFDTNNSDPDNDPNTPDVVFPAPGQWQGLRIDPGANSSRIENSQLINGTIVRTSSDRNPYTIGDEPGSDTDSLWVNPNGPAAGIVASEQNVQDGVLIENATIRYAVRGIDNRGYPDGKLSIEGAESEVLAGGRDNYTNGGNLSLADGLLPLGFDPLGNSTFSFDSFSGSLRVAGNDGNEVLSARDVDVFVLPQKANFPPNVSAIGFGDDIVSVRVDHSIDDSPDNGFINIFGFNTFNQLIYVNSPFLNNFGPLNPVQGTSGYLGQMTWLTADQPYTIPSENSPPARVRDLNTIVISSGLRMPAVIENIGGVRPQNTAMILNPINGDPANGFTFGLMDIAAMPPAEIPTPRDATFRDQPNGFAIGGYEIEIRTPNFVQGVDIHDGRDADAIRALEGEYIFRNNRVENSLEAGVSLDRAAAGAGDARPNFNVVVGTQVGNYTLPAQTARYGYANNTNGDFAIDPRTGDFFNPQWLIPGAQVYNNVIINGGRDSSGNAVTGAPGDGLIVRETPNNIAPGAGSGLPVPTSYDLVQNNTFDNNVGDGMDLFGRGGLHVLNNLITNNGPNGDFGILVNDTGDLQARDLFLFPRGTARNVISFNTFFNNGQGGSGHFNQGADFNGTNNTFADPLYVDAARGDYRLRVTPTSPAIDSSLSDLSDRLNQARLPNEPTRAPNDDQRRRSRLDNPLRQNTGGGQFPFFDRGALEAAEASLRVVSISSDVFTSTGVVPGPVNSLLVRFAGRVDPTTINPNTVRINVQGLGTNVPVQSVTEVAYDNVRNIHTFRINMVNPILAGSYTLTLDGVSASQADPAIRDIVGQILDGEFDGVSFPSGNGVPGGNFVYDFVVQMGSIGDTVYHDVNGNMVQDAGEPGIGAGNIDPTTGQPYARNVGLILRGAGPDGLFGTADDTATTTAADNFGKYLFINLAAGNYRVFVDESTLPSNFALTTSNIPFNFTLLTGQQFSGADFGYRLDPRNSVLGNLVWNDQDGDGVRDAGEPGIANVQVDYLGSGPDLDFTTTADNVQFQPVFTDANGGYSITNLPAWRYRVTIAAANFNPGRPLAGFVNTVGPDSRLSPFEVLLAPSEVNNTVDFGYQKQNSSIGDLVFDDLNRNGVRDFGEPGLAGVVLQLTEDGPDGVFGNADDVSYGQRVTDNSGSYSFTTLPAGRYRVEVAGGLPAMYAITTNNNPLIVNLANDTNLTTADFGAARDDQNGVIGDLIWHDVDGDGILDNGEQGLPGITVQLFRPDANGNFTILDRTTLTNANGLYQFGSPNPGAGLPGGRYMVQVLDGNGTPLQGFVRTFTPVQGNNPPQVFNLGPGQQINLADFGYQRQDSSVGGIAYNDLNGNGVQDAGETGFNGVGTGLVVFIDLDNDGVLDGNERSSTVAANGAYLIDKLPPSQDLVGGPYRIRMGLPAGFFTTTPNPVVANLPGATNLVVNFGIIERNAQVGDRTFNDLNGNGVQDAGEPGLAGVMLHLDYAGPDGVFNGGDDVIDFLTATSNANGDYLFASLDPGTYRARADLPAESTATTPTSRTVTLISNQKDLTVDFGFVVPTIGDKVFRDNNGNQVFDAGDVGLANVLVFIDADNDGVFDAGERSTTTNANGDYFLTSLPAGTHRVRVDRAASPALNGLIQTTGDAQGNIVVNLAAGQVLLTADFAFEPAATIRGTVFNDADGDGILDAGEAGVGGVGVFLDLNGDQVLSLGEPTATSAADGSYAFNNLTSRTAANPYRVRVRPETAPAGAVLTSAQQQNVVLGVGATAVVDFGFRLKGQLDVSTLFVNLVPSNNSNSSQIRSTDDNSLLRFRTNDVLRLQINPAGTYHYSMFLKGADVGLTTGGEAIDAFTFVADANAPLGYYMLISTRGSVSVQTTYATPGRGTGAIITGASQDLLKFVPTQVGDRTAGTWSMFFDGSVVGLSGSSENVDGVTIETVQANGLPRLLISTTGNFVTNDLKAGRGEDVIAFNMTRSGANNTQGTWEFFFDGSDVGLGGASENVDGVFLQPNNAGGLPSLIFTTTGSFSVPRAGGTVTGTRSDVFQFDPTRLDPTPVGLGGTTAGNFLPNLVVAGAAVGLGNFNLNDMWIGGLPPAVRRAPSSFGIGRSARASSDAFFSRSSRLAGDLIDPTLAASLGRSEKAPSSSRASGAGAAASSRLAAGQPAAASPDVVDQLFASEESEERSLVTANGSDGELAGEEWWKTL